MPATDENATFRSAVITDFTLQPEPDNWAGKLAYVAWGEETCPTTGKPHLQMFAYSIQAQRKSWWNKIFPKRYVARMLGNFAQNEVYCSKVGTYHEWGTKPMGNGEKRSLHVMKDKLDEGLRPVEVAAEHPELFQVYCQYRGGLEQYAAHINRKKYKGDYSAPFVQWSFGPTGTGKTRDVVGRHENLFIVPDLTGKWFDGYNGEEAVLFDDTDKFVHLPRSTFLRLCDRYGQQVPVKGGFAYWKPKYIYFTSNYHWDYIYGKDPAIERRISWTRDYRPVLDE